MVIVDTTVWVDYLANRSNPHTDWLDRELDRQRLGLVDLILCEVLQGIRYDEQYVRVLRDLRQFEVFTTGGEDLAVVSAKNYRMLRSKGLTVRKTIDSIIAAFCIQQGHSLLHRDRDFDAFEEHLHLQVIHP